MQFSPLHDVSLTLLNVDISFHNVNLSLPDVHLSLPDVHLSLPDIDLSLLDEVSSFGNVDSSLLIPEEDNLLYCGSVFI